MDTENKLTVDSPIGRQNVDASGAPVGVVRMDVEKSYAGIGELLKDYINNSNQSSWNDIKIRIDYTCSCLDQALGPLAKKTGLPREIADRLKKGQKLLFKPNLVGLINIDPQTHGPTPASTTCTEWPFIAALMRWFHDKLNVSYYQMCLGEAATVMPAAARMLTMLHPDGKKITTEAALEGKCGDFYGGWGFYFVRKYLSEKLSGEHSDDPMRGYEESLAGRYIPPGQVSDKLMLYDLNRIYDDSSKGREIEVPAGVNYRNITLHKAIIGADPSDADDMVNYPGCILVNVPKFKVHAITLFTNIIKNLGIGLYPMQFSRSGGHQWDYSDPNDPVPGMKASIPHEVWVAEMDRETNLPKRDENGRYIVHKTGGITATMIDIVKAVMNQNIFMIHIVDGIEAINVDHTGTPAAQRVPEGMVFAGLDPVAADLLCARYMFSNVPIAEAVNSGIDDGHGGFFPQAVPVPRLDDGNIISEAGLDSPLARDICFQRAEARGLGKRAYHVIGKDMVTDCPIVTLQGHLGTIESNMFKDLITQTRYYDLYKLPWDLQKTAFGYMEAVDQLEKTSLKKEFLDAFDENGDGIVAYEEFGKKGAMTGFLHAGAASVSAMAAHKFGYLKSGFGRVSVLRNSNPSMNAEGHDLFKDFLIGSRIFVAYQMSQMENEGPDPFFPGLTWGKGKWPSYQLVRFIQMGSFLYGGEFPYRVVYPSLYSAAFFYADQTQNGGGYAGRIRSEPNPDAIEKYFEEVQSGRKEPLDFIFYVPEGFANLSGAQVPNVQTSSDPSRVLTVSFDGGKEIWT